MAESFVNHPYWAIVSKMLSGTIQSETEDMLTTDERIHVNRASVAMCRKVLQMPFFDIQQGTLARTMLAVNEAKLGLTRGAASAADNAWQKRAI